MEQSALEHTLDFGRSTSIQIDVSPGVVLHGILEDATSSRRGVVARVTATAEAPATIAHVLPHSARLLRLALSITGKDGERYLVVVRVGQPQLVATEVFHGVMPSAGEAQHAMSFRNVVDVLTIARKLRLSRELDQGLVGGDDERLRRVRGRSQTLTRQSARRVGVELTSPARRMLAVLVEEQLARAPFQEVQLTSALDDIVEAMRDSPDQRDAGTARMRSTVSVVRALWNKYCNIPPFCRPVDAPTGSTTVKGS